jgi:gliding motility-associated-like protein
MKKIATVLIFLSSLLMNGSSYGQVIYYQDNCHCGVTGAGFSTLMAGGSDTLKVHIAPGSTIRKAYLFVTEYWNNSIPPIDFHVELENETYIFNSSTRLSNINTHPESTTPNVYIHSIDITENINPEDSTFFTVIPNVNISNCSGCIFSTVYLYILYENPNLNLTSSYILINNQDEQYSSDFQIDELNTFSSNSDIGFSICAARINDYSPGDGSYLSFNNGIQVGLLEGEGNLAGDGPQGCFYFENDALTGLSNDTPDNFVNGSDALMNVDNLITPNHSLIWNLTWEQFMVGARFNIYNEFFIEHGTTCESNVVTVSQDTTICANTPLLLEASGGITYEWSPSIHLSCTTCANPIFVSDSSELLTVRIRYTDSCSVIRSMKINVLKNPEFNKIQINSSICGTDSGNIVITPKAEGDSLFNYQLDQGAFQNNASFSSVSSGIHTITLMNSHGCQSDTLVTVSQLNQTTANFQASQTIGATPFDVILTNTSANANQFDWYVNNVLQTGDLNHLNISQSGIYHIELISWQFDPSCADTVQLIIHAYDALLLNIPNVITPNNDQINDVFTIQSNMDVSADVYIFNRWGNNIVEFHGTLLQGETHIWDGKEGQNEVSEGTYFYQIELKNLDSNQTTVQLPYLPKIIEGFMEIRH